MMVKEFKLPDVGEGLTEANIVAWHVKPGEAVEDGQIIVEIETAKAVVELPCPWDGTVARLLAEEGQTVEVGVPIIAVEVGGRPMVPNGPRFPPPRPPRARPRTRPRKNRARTRSWSATASRPRRPPAARARVAAGRPETAEVPTRAEVPVEPPEVPAEPAARSQPSQRCPSRHCPSQH